MVLLQKLLDKLCPMVLLLQKNIETTNKAKQKSIDLTQNENKTINQQIETYGRLIKTVNDL